MKDQEECNSLYSKGNQFVTKDLCLAGNGIWTENENGQQSQFAKVNGEEVKVTGRCDLSAQAQECNTNLQKKYGNLYGNPYGPGKNSNYDRAQFFTGTAFGVIIIIISIFIPAEIAIVGISLAIGGVFVLIRSTFSYWNYFSDIWKFGILIIAFIALVLVAIKKLRK